MDNDITSRNSPRKWWLPFTGLAILLLLLSGCGGQAKVYKVGILCGLNYIHAVTDGFKAKMTELGYVEGKNIIYDEQRTDFDLAKYKTFAQKFVADKVDLIFAYPTEAALEAKAAAQGTNIPVVFNFAFIEGNDLVKSLREPGGNVTGVRYPGPDIALRRLEILHELAPKAKRIYLPYQKGYPTIPSQMAALKPVATEAGIVLIDGAVDGPPGLQAALDALPKTGDVGFDAIMFFAEPLTVEPAAFAAVAKFAYDHKLPFGGAYMTAGDYRALYGVNVEPVSSGKLSAPIVDKIFKGTAPGMIPVVSADGFFQMDYKAAQDQGVTVSDGLLKMADEVIR